MYLHAFNSVDLIHLNCLHVLIICCGVVVVLLQMRFCFVPYFNKCLMVCLIIVRRCVSQNCLQVCHTSPLKKAWCDIWRGGIQELEKCGQVGCR